MPRSDGLDDFDRRLVHALQLDGRVSLSRLADVLGGSDRTVARRLERLRSQHRMRVVARTDWERVGETLWLVRVRCEPAAASPLALALGRRRDTSWVRITSGGTELTTMTRSAAGAAEGQLLERLPRTAHVRDVTADSVLHVFYGGRQGVARALDGDQIAALRRPELRGGPPLDLDDDDRALIEALADNGRRDFASLERMLARPASTVRRRLAELVDRGAIYFDVDIDYHDLGMNTLALLWLSVAPDRLAAAGAAFATHPEVAFAAATTGRTNLYVSVACSDDAALYHYLTTRVAGIAGLQRIETAPVLRTVKGV